MIGVLARIPLYQLMRRYGRPRMLPLNVTVGVTYRCNSRCLTCRVYEKDGDEFSAHEFDRAFASLGRAPYWFTMSGGEPFLRDDLAEICHSAYRRCAPGIINIPTNGLLVSRIGEMAGEIAGRCADSQIIVNLSLDGIGAEHDRIRGVSGNYERVIEAYHALRSLPRPNLAVGIHTVISVHNVQSVPDIYRHVQSELRPDAFITEIAEERVELSTVGLGVAPDARSYGRAVDFLVERLREERFSGLARITQSFRMRYYGLVKRYLESGTQPIPCYAGVASTQIAPDGDVWLCCVLAEPVGNLRESAYDFRRIWFGPEASAARARVARAECACPLANASYTNMLMHGPTVRAVALEVARSRLAAPSGRA